MPQPPVAPSQPVIDLSDIPDAPPLTATPPPVTTGRGGVDLSDIPDQPPSLTDKAAHAIAETRAGIRSGLATTVFRGGDLIRRAITGVAGDDALADHPQLASFLGLRRIVNEPDVQDLMARPTTTAGKVGRFAEQAGEFMLPAGEISEAVKGSGIAARLVRAGISPSRAALVTGAVEGVGQGASAYGLTKLQGNEGAGTAAAISAVAPVAGAAFDTLYPAIKASAASRMQALLKKAYKPEDITPRIERITADAAQAMLDLPVQRTWSQWRAATGAQRAEVGTTLAAALRGPLGDTAIPKQPILSGLDDLLATKAQHLTNLTALDDGHFTGTTATYNPPLAAAVTDLKQILAQYPDDIPARQLHDIKQTWQAAVFPRRDAGQPLASIQEQLTTAQKEARLRGSDAIARVLDAHAPQIADLDDAVAHAIQLDQLVRRLSSRAGVKPLTGTLLRAAGGLGGYALADAVGSGGYPGHILGVSLGYATARMVQQALTSPLWQMASPHLRNQLAEAIASGQVRQVQRLVAPLLAAGVSQLSRSVNPSAASVVGSDSLIQGSAQ